MSHPIAPRTIVEAFLPDRGEAALETVYDTANAMGLDDQPVRLAIRRMQAAGELRQHGRGRGGAIELTASGRARIDLDRSAVDLAFAQDSGAVRWDGAWRICTIGTAERERQQRDALRRQLTALGAAPLATGVFISPHELRPALADEAIAQIVLATVTGLEVRGTADPRAIAELLWPAGPIVSANEAIASALADDDAAAPPDVRRILLADALETALRDDPLVPSELRAAPWRPADLRRRWLRRWNEIGPGAAYASWQWVG